MAEAQCLFQRPPSALAQVIPSKFERRDGGVGRSVFASARPPPSPRPFTLSSDVRVVCSQHILATSSYDGRGAVSLPAPALHPRSGDSLKV
jgi:hypothetical protein